ncbi:helix-turn-helix domain-containing protein [Vagococcus luciliae]|uniref:HTH cro/C1-type domain-containing protein n=1 Tax=Vagococcus luciliae TaxID=2920380 RepID=A0ABY5NWM2_9ENTE|nr:helix-turn-helix transcriptional regulator [Vagococcus luciliae]UUV97998.1 hypothetical protein G314FT_00890 [Vagococcus luciliae]
MIVFHLDKLLKEHDLTINSLTNILNEKYPKDKNVSRKTITAIANNSAKNIQLSTLEQLTDYFKIPLDKLMTLTTNNLKYIFRLIYPNSLFNVKTMIGTKDKETLLPQMYLEIFEDNKLIESFVFHIIVTSSEDESHKIIDSISFLPVLSTPHEYKNNFEEFEEKLNNNQTEVYSAFYELLNNYLSKLTIFDIEDIFKLFIESILTNLKSFFADSLTISSTLYFDITNFLIVPLLVDEKDSKITVDFSIAKHIQEFGTPHYKNLSEQKKVYVETEIKTD